MPQKAKKLVMVLVDFMSITEKKEHLERILYIKYLVIFKDQTEALLDLGSGVNIISQVFAF